MTDTNGTQRGLAPAQLGARARTILRSLAEGGSAKLAPAPERADPPVREPSTDEMEARRARRRAMARSGEAAPAAQPAGPAEPNKIVSLPRRGRSAPKPGPAQERPRAIRAVASKPKTKLLKISAALAIGLPTAIATLYYGFIAAPQYVAEAKFAVRSPEEAPTSGNLIGQITGINSAALVMSESFIVTQFIESRHLVENLQKSVDLRTIYTNDGADFIARYRPYATDDAPEHLTRYWNTVASVYYEPVSSIITLTVRAFTPDDALKVARETVRESEQLVNRLSERAREDAIFDTKQELSRAELRLKFARKAIQDYRDREGSVDPAKNAESQLTIISTLEGELAKQEADMASAISFLSADAPTVRVMRNKIDALKKRIGVERAKIGNQQLANPNASRPLLSSSLAEFEGLMTERQFAEKAYESALTSVENARIRAERQSRYLATFVEPQLPQDSLYPQRIRSILLVLLCSAIAWAIGVLIFYGIRDHAA